MSAAPENPPVNPFTHFAVVDRGATSGKSGLEFLQDVMAGRLPAPPFYQTGEIWQVEAKYGEVAFLGLPSEKFYNLVGTVHGGWISLLLDSGLAVAVLSTLQPGQTFTTLEFKVNFVRAVTAQTGPLRCEGKIVHRGGRVATSESRAYDGAGRLVAHASSTCLIMEAK
ncbi:MAG: PaaI family thioesterase [Verrucomicrobia bacterium]|nr:PaaI family thioesterase [Verrucomicrobiota bacterium]